MKREWNCIRDILLKLEEWPGSGWIVELDGWNEATVRRHVNLCIDLKLLRVEGTTSDTGQKIKFTDYHITSHGYDFLAMINKPGVWEFAFHDLERSKIPATYENLLDLITRYSLT